MEALFEEQAGGFLPAACTRGPWDRGALHGGAVGALVARAIEQVPAPLPMHVTRLTLELLRPVPLQLLEVSAGHVRPGKLVDMLGASVSAGGREVCRATAWRVRRAEAPVAEPIPIEPPTMPPPAAVATTPPPSIIGDETSFGRDAIEARIAEGGWEPGPSRLWMRLRLPLLAGEEPSPLARTMAVADFCNGVCSSLSWEEHTFANTDLTVYLEREPAGEWIGIDGRMRHDRHGYAVAESVLFDEDGRIGRGLQSVYVARRPAASG